MTEATEGAVVVTTRSSNVPFVSAFMREVFPTAVNVCLREKHHYIKPIEMNSCIEIHMCKRKVR